MAAPAAWQCQAKKIWATGSQGMPLDYLLVQSRPCGWSQGPGLKCPLSVSHQQEIRKHACDRSL